MGAFLVDIHRNNGLRIETFVFAADAPLGQRTMGHGSAASFKPAPP